MGGEEKERGGAPPLGGCRPAAIDGDIVEALLKAAAWARDAAAAVAAGAGRKAAAAAPPPPRAVLHATSPCRACCNAPSVPALRRAEGEGRVWKGA